MTGRRRNVLLLIITFCYIVFLWTWPDLVKPINNHVADDGVRGLPPFEFGRLGLSDLLVVLNGYERADWWLAVYEETWLKGVRHLWMTTANRTLQPANMIFAAVQSEAENNRYNENDIGFPIGVAAARRIYYPDFKWLLLGDADTYFVLPALLPMLSVLDHTKPQWIGNVHPPGSRCDATSSTACCDRLNVTCRLPEKLNATVDWCAISDRQGNWPDLDHVALGAHPFPFVRNQSGGLPLYPLPPRWTWGGGGTVLSVALVGVLSQRDWDMCAATMKCGGTDIRIAACLNLHGFGPQRCDNFGGWELPRVLNASDNYTFPGSGMLSGHRLSGRNAGGFFAAEERLFGKSQRYNSVWV
jgi:hypothetical protein